MMKDRITNLNWEYKLYFHYPQTFRKLNVALRNLIENEFHDIIVVDLRYQLISGIPSNMQLILLKDVT